MFRRYVKEVRFLFLIFTLLLLVLFLCGRIKLIYTFFTLLSENGITTLIQYLLTVFLGILGLYYAFAFIGYQSFRREYGKEILNHYLSEISPDIFTLICIIWIAVLLVLFVFKSSLNILIVNYILLICTAGSLFQSFELYKSYRNFYTEKFLNNYIYMLMNNFYKDRTKNKNSSFHLCNSYQSFQSMCLHALTTNNKLFPEILFSNYSSFVINKKKYNRDFDITLLDPLEKEISFLCEKFKEKATLNLVLSKYVDFIKDLSSFSAYDQQNENIALVIANFCSFNGRMKNQNYKNIVTPHIANLFVFLINKPSILSEDLTKRIGTFIERFEGLQLISNREFYSALMDNVECLEVLLENENTSTMVKKIFSFLGKCPLDSNDGIDSASFSKLLNEKTVNSGLFYIIYPIFVEYSIRLIHFYLSLKIHRNEIARYIELINLTTNIAVSKELFNKKFFQEKVLSLIQTLKPFEKEMRVNNINFDSVKNLIEKMD